jgi:hypothetical protein
MLPFNSSLEIVATNCFRFYQEFLGKSLTEKYAGLSTQMDKVIHNANSEIATLHGKVSGLSRLLFLSCSS